MSTPAGALLLSIGGVTETLGSCRSVLVGNGTLELYSTVPYRRHVINPLNLWAPNA